jgi:hypothetical protein
LQHLYATCLELSCEKTPCAVVLTQFTSQSRPHVYRPPSKKTYLPNFRQLVVVLKEEAQVLVADVDVRIPAQPSVLFLRLAPAAESMAVDLILDLIRCVVHVYARVDVRRAHLCLRALQRGEELCVQQARLRVPQLVRDVARQAEIRILVDRTWNQARDVGLCTENLREGVGKGRRGLDRAKVYLADVVTEQTKNILVKMRASTKRRRRQGGGRERGTYESPKPNVALAWLRVIWRETFDTFL